MTATEILKLVLTDPIDVDALESALDSADHETRLAATRLFTGKIQKRLFEAMAGRPVETGQIVPTDETLKEVIHEGTNTLPAFRHFQKRFARPTDPENGAAVGYNHNWYMFATSPGYFTSYEDSDNGEFVIDYTKPPTEKATQWPKIISNKFGLGIFVWTGMIDRLRRVSTHVTIGRAYRGEKPMNAWFVLARQD